MVRFRAPASPSIHTDLPCRCGYNLRGLPRESRCPECGYPIELAADYHHNLAVFKRRVVKTTLLVVALVVIVYFALELKQEWDRPRPTGPKGAEWVK